MGSLIMEEAGPEMRFLVEEAGENSVVGPATHKFVFETFEILRKANLVESAG